MSDVTLICGANSHGLAMETRSGHFEVKVASDGTTIRHVNYLVVDTWPENSRTAKHLENLFQKFKGQLSDMNYARQTDSPLHYRELFWRIKGELKGE